MLTPEQLAGLIAVLRADSDGEVRYEDGAIKLHLPAKRANILAPPAVKGSPITDALLMFAATEGIPEAES